MPDFGKDWRPPARATTPSQLTDRLNQLRSTLRVLDPGWVAAQSGISHPTAGLDSVELQILFWDDVCILPFPELTGCNNRGEPLPDFQQALLLYYLVTADGTPLTGKWVSFADLPDGRMYNAAFQGYSGNEIAKRFGLGLDAFKVSCSKAGGKPADIGSASFMFQALPRVPLMATYWLGDEDFPSSCKILFDKSASRYLPIDACAILGSMLTRRLIRS
jgi:hypothetical protein